MNLKHIIASFILVLVAISGAYSQNQIELLGAKSLKFDKHLGLDAQRLIGNVKFRHKGALMYCDSAYLYNENNSLDAFGNVKIVQGDTLTLLSNTLFYDGITELIEVRDSVRLKDKDMTLTTNILDYDRPASTAVFRKGGVITSRVNDNTLSSKSGVYNSESKMFFFRDSVLLENPKYLVETDTLNYASIREVAYFEGPTFIYSDENTIYCENGWYDTKNDLSQFNENAYLDNGKQKLSGDSLAYDRNKGVGEAFINVLIVDTVDRYILTGQEGYYDDLQGKSKVTGDPEFILYDKQDSLFLHGDTLIALADSIKGDRILVYPHVKFFRKDLQGAADSLVYLEADSMIHMYENPVLWAEDMQITGDTIQIKSFGGEIKNLFVFEHAFMVNKIDSLKYNQIKGKSLTGFFQNNELTKVEIKGNGESIYYATESTPDSLANDSIPPPQKFIGVNKAICSNIAIYVKSNQIDRIVFLKKPDGAFFPVSKFPADEAIFDGFEWQEYRRPKNRKEIFLQEDNEDLVETED